MKHKNYSLLGRIANWFMLFAVVIGTLSMPIQSLAATPSQAVKTTELAPAKEQTQPKESSGTTEESLQTKPTEKKELADSTQSSQTAKANDSPQYLDGETGKVESYQATTEDTWKTIDDEVAKQAEEKNEQLKEVADWSDIDWEDPNTLLSALNKADFPFVSVEDVLSKVKASEQIEAYYKTKDYMATHYAELTVNTRMMQATDLVLKRSKNINPPAGQVYIVNSISSVTGQNFMHDVFVKWWIAGHDVFCIEDGVPAGEGLTHAEGDLKKLVGEKLARKWIGLATFAWYNNSDKSDMQYIATQVAVWKARGMKVIDYVPQWSADLSNRVAFAEKNYQSIFDMPKFDSTNKTVKAGQDAVFTDTRGLLSSNTFISNVQGNATAEIKGNSVIVHTTKNSDKRVTIRIGRGVVGGEAKFYGHDKYQKIGLLQYVDPDAAQLTVNVQKDGKMILRKVDEQNKPLAGVTFKLAAKGKTTTAKTNVKGEIATPVYDIGTKVTYEETETVAGHYIDPETSKGSITIKEGDNVVVVKNPTVKIGVTSQASNQDGAQFINPSKGQKLRDEVLIDAERAPKDAKLRLTTDFVAFGTGEQLGKESLKQVEEFDAPQAKFVHNVYLEFDASGMNGKKGVFTNVLEYYNPSTKEWEEVARHDDLNNEQESIQFVAPEVHTELFFYDQNDKTTKLTDPLKKVKGYDRVFYKNLIAGQSYTFDLSMMNRETEKEFLDPNGKPITGTLTVVAGKDGEVMSTINAKDYYANLNPDTETPEKPDTDETSDKPSERTTAREEPTEGDTPEVATDFSALTDVDLVTGSVDVPFEANLSAANSKILVAYEQVTTNETVVAEHKDLKDDKQTGKVRNPKIGTKALVNGKTEVTTDGKVTLTDEIAYEDLTPNVEYEATLTWMDARTKQPVKIDGKELKSTIKFTPKEAAGTAIVTIKDVAVQQLFGKDSKFSLVAFEEVTSKGEKIAEHKDIKDKGQTITIVKPVAPVTPKPATPTKALPQTSGTLGNPITWIVLGLGLMAGAIFVFVKTKRQEQK